MMDVKEKLVEIIQNSVGGCARYWAEVIADGLLANGVTAQHRLEEKQATSDNGKRSNADRIRAMSDDELAKWIVKTQCEIIKNLLQIPEITYIVKKEIIDEFAKAVLDWLQQPAEESEL